MRKYLLLLTILPLISSCENTWDSDARRLFKEGCMNAATKDGMEEQRAEKMCDCRLEKVMEKYPNFANAMDNLDKLMVDTSFRVCDEVAN